MSRLEDTMQPTPRENRETTTPTLSRRARPTRLPKSPSRSACSHNPSHIRLPCHLRVPLLKYRILPPSHVQLLHHRPFNVLVPRQVNQEIHGYKVVEHVATGATGYVLRATFGQGATEMALKIPILKTTSRVRGVNEPTTGVTTLNETMSEATRLLELSGQSKYVVQIRGVLVDRLNVQEIVKGNIPLYYRSPPAIVMDFMKGGTAKKLIEDPAYEPLYYSEKWGGIVVMLGQMMAQALDMVHKAGFVHLDVKG